MTARFRQWIVKTPLWSFIRDHSSPERKAVLLRRYIRFIGLWEERSSFLPALRRLERPSIYFKDMFASSANEQEIRFALKNGPAIWVRSGSNDRFIFDEVFFREFYRSGLPPATESVKTIVDVGAQAGMTSIWLHGLYPEATIHLVEPMPDNFALLQKNVAENKLQNALHTHQLALNDQAGEIVIMRNPENKGGHSMFAQEFTGEEVHVSCMRLDAFFAQQGIEQCDLMKMDVEGAEYPILYTTPKDVLRKIKYFLMEHHFVAGKQNYHGEALEAFFRQNGYEVERGARHLFARRLEEKKTP